jgi:hypothetical protein
MKAEKVINLAEFKPTWEELKEVGINAQIIPMPPKSLYDPMPLPEKFSVGIYENGTGANVYNVPLMEDVARAMPDIKFYFFGDETKKGQTTDNTEHLGFIDMKEWMPKLSCCVRVTVHDGLPLGPVEFMMAGRQVVTNVRLEGTIQVKANKKDIIEGIRKAQQSSIKPKWGPYWKKVLDQGKYIRFIYSLIK